MKKGFALIAVIAVSSVFVASIADASTLQKKKKSTPVKKKSSGGYSGPETGLLGIKLYDSGLRVISVYGNPDTITTVGGGATGASGGGGQGGPPGGFGGGGGNGGGGGGGAPSRPTADVIIPGGIVPGAFGEPTPDLQKGGPRGAPTGGPPPGQGGSSVGAPQGAGSAPGGSGFGPSGGGAGGAGAATEAAVFTRWTYLKNGCRYGFVIDKFDRVIQIEAIGLQNQRVKTRRGVSFGSTFSTVMKNYASGVNDPDGYDISGNNFTIRFLTRQRVAFRLSQLSSKKAHVVTGIVVAAGKQ